MKSQGKLLLVDDNPLMLEALVETFSYDYDYVASASGDQALSELAAHTDFDAIVLDIRMEGTDGLQVADRIVASNADIPIIFFTGYAGDYNEDELQEKYHPFAYITKNEKPERLIREVAQAVRYHRFSGEGAEMVRLARKEYDLVGHSEQMQQVYRTIEKVGPTMSKVVILGPTGTGKELVARALYRRSERAGQRLAIFNCNHKAPDLVEAELFGHVRGAFTGAVADRVGVFEYADRGTVFLDEVGDLDVTTQGKLLRVLETGEIQRIGAPDVRKVDVRLLCATHHDLKRLVEDGRFREDLYYRLDGVTIHMPALCERRGDIPDLIDYFAERHANKTGRGLKIFDQEARNALIQFDWPGNVRQLMDAVQSLIDVTPSHYITRTQVEAYLGLQGVDGNGPDGGSRRTGLSSKLQEYKRTLIVQALDRYNNNMSAAARDLDVDPSNFRKLCKELGLK